MAGFCTRCGSPLPENGVCPNCAPQQPQYQQPQYQAPQQPQYQAPQQPQYQAPQYQAPQYQQPQYQAPQYQQYQAPQYQQQPQYQQPYQQPQYQQHQPQPQPAPQPAAPSEPSAFSIAMGKFKDFLGSFVKEPTSALKNAVDNGEMMTGFFTMALTIMAAFLTLLAIDLCYGNRFYAGLWLFNSFITPVLIYGIGLGGLFLIGLVGKNKKSFKSVVAATGATGLLPTAFIMVALILSMFGEVLLCGVLYPLFLVLIGVSYAVTVTRAMDNKMNLWQILILVAILFIGYYVLDALMQNYFVKVLYGSYYSSWF